MQIYVAIITFISELFIAYYLHLESLEIEQVSGFMDHVQQRLLYQTDPMSVDAKSGDENDNNERYEEIRHKQIRVLGNADGRNPHNTDLCTYVCTYHECTSSQHTR